MTAGSLVYSGPGRESYFGQTRSELMPLIPLSAGKILDLGCGCGGLGAAVKARQDAWYCGVDISKEAASTAGKFLDDVKTGDLDSMPLPYDDGTFDTMIMADVLEHLPDPERVVRRWLRLLCNGGRVVVSLPNVRHFSVTLPLLFNGRWEYRDRGILDRTHLRFFTRASARSLLVRSGLRIENERANWSHGHRAVQMFDFLSLRLFREHFAQQWLFLAVYTL